ncbi:hypothetical protein BOX15_Mlig023471g2, partial [Macrostomum lignano]
SAVRLVQSSVGAGLHGFRHVRSAQVPTFRLTLEELVHEATGCRLVHLARQDANNAFAIQLRTTPTDSTGAPHILEHSVLCGSAKYPVRDPFFKMLTRSQATFMNAMTAPDFTIYPCSTQNPTDFYNLFSVYLDAVFHPLLSRMDFLQEGWRLEPVNLQEPQSPITIKGVVYNEMKGVFSDPDQLFANAVRQNLLPAGPYRHNFGGFPGAIPELSHEQLLQFHRRHYHPSNATVFTYGSLPLAEHLRFLDSECLAGFGRIDCSATAVPLEPRWSKPRAGRVDGPLNPFLPPDRQVTLAESFLFGDVCQVRDNFHLHFVSSLLCEGDTSPFYSGLLESGLGTAFAPVHGFSSDCRNTAFHIGLKGLADESVAAARQRVDDILAETVRSGFRQVNVDSLLHQVELGLRDEGANFGLEKILALAGPANHGADLAELLAAEDLLEDLRRTLAEQPRYLQSLVDRHWRSNPHRLSLSLHPTARYADRLLAAEKTAATARAANADLAAVRREAQELLAAQTARADPGPLPRLALGDLPRQAPRWSTEWAVPDRLLLCPQPTNGLVYFRAKLRLSDLSTNQTRLLPLLSLLLPKLGTARTPYGQLAEAIDLVSGGFACTPYATARPDEAASSCESGLVFSACCLAPNLPRVLQLWQEICAQPDWAARDRLANLLRMEAADLVSRLTGQGHAFAAGRAAARLSESSRVADLLTGLDSLRAIKLAAAAEPAGFDALAEDLADLCRTAFRRENFCISLTGEQPETGAKEVEAFLAGFDVADAAAHAAAARPPQPRFDLGGGATGTASGGLFEHFEVGSMGVNFCAQAFPCPAVTHPRFPALMLAAAHLSSRYLHREIREIGGAYGSGARATPGAFYFMSYRDPRSLATLDSFAASAEWLAGRVDSLTDSDLEEAKLAVFKTLDMPVPPKKRGLEFFLTGVTDDMRQQLRDRLFDLDTSEVRQAAAETLGQQQKTHKVIIGCRNLELDFKQWTSSPID